MQKRILIITSAKSNDKDRANQWQQRQKYITEFYGDLATRLENVNVAYTTYDDIQYSVRGNSVRITDTRHGLDLDKVDLVHFKNWMFNHEEAALIAFYLRVHDVTFFNSEVDAGLAWGKISQMCRLALGGVPVPDTFFAKKQLLRAQFQVGTLPEGLAFPLIMKADDGTKGSDNYLVKTAAQALKILARAPLEKQFVLQNFIPNDGDYRFLFMGIDEPPLVFSRQAVAGSHLNNTSQGGKGTFIEPKTLPKTYFEVAKHAATILKREISGVDILVDKTTGAFYVLEVNSTPALATGYGVDVKVQAFAKFLQHVFKDREEE